MLAVQGDDAAKHADGRRGDRRWLGSGHARGVLGNLKLGQHEIPICGLAPGPVVGQAGI